MDKLIGAFMDEAVLRPPPPDLPLESFAAARALLALDPAGRAEAVAAALKPLSNSVFQRYMEMDRLVSLVIEMLRGLPPMDEAAAVRLAGACDTFHRLDVWGPALPEALLGALEAAVAAHGPSEELLKALRAIPWSGGKKPTQETLVLVGRLRALQELKL